jgi:hypothetical protein
MLHLVSYYCREQSELFLKIEPELFNKFAGMLNYLNSYIKFPELELKTESVLFERLLIHFLLITSTRIVRKINRLYLITRVPSGTDS